jgi:hypothetical protein
VSKLVKHCPFRQSDFHSRLPASFLLHPTRVDIFRTDLLSNLCLCLRAWLGPAVSIWERNAANCAGPPRYEYYGTASLRSALGSTSTAIIGTRARNRRSCRYEAFQCAGLSLGEVKMLHCLSVCQFLTPLRSVTINRLNARAGQLASLGVLLPPLAPFGIRIHSGISKVS